MPPVRAPGASSRGDRGPPLVDAGAGGPAGGGPPAGGSFGARPRFARRRARCSGDSAAARALFAAAIFALVASEGDG